MRNLCKLISFIVVFPLMASAKTNSTEELVKPRWNDWVCWYSSKKDSECVAYGYSRSRQVALEKAQKLCEKHCESSCMFEYCEFFYNR